jgi:hypothetical protein
VRSHSCIELTKQQNRGAQASAVVTQVTMSRLFKMLFLTIAFGAVSVAHADLDHGATEGTSAAVTAGDGDNLYYGVGVFSDMLNLNVEAVTRWGNFMVRAGKFGDNEGLGANLSWRRPLERELDGHASGYYIGAFAGQVTGETLNDQTHFRLGGGVEMGYHWVKEYSRTELTVGVGAAEPLEEGPTKNPTKLEAEPTIFFSFNWALGY